MSIKLAVKKTSVVLKDYVEVNGRKFFVDGKNVVLEPSNKEIGVAKWLSKRLNQTVELIPRVNLPKNIQTSDYIIEGECWDLKVVNSNLNDAISSRVKNREKQAVNFVIDVSKSKLTMKASVNQINNLYKARDFRWLNNIIIKKNNDFQIISKK